MKKWLLVLFILFQSIPCYASVALQEDFEYGATEAFPGNDTGCTNSVMVSSGPWDEIADSRCHADKYGQFSIVDSSGVPFTDAYTGKIPQGSYVLRMTNTNTGSQQCTAHLLKSSLNTGSDWWFQFWLARARTGAEVSANLGFHGIKFPFNFPYDSSWISWGNANCITGTGDNSQIDPLNGGGADGTYIIGNWDAESDGGCGNGCGNSNCWYNANLMEADETLEAYAIRPNRWHLVKMHIKAGSSQSAHILDTWIDNRDGTGFHKVQSKSGSTAPAWSANRQWNGTLQFFLQEPASGGASTAGRQWIYVDDIVFATTEGDLPTYSGDTTPPTLSSATIGANGTSLTLAFSEAVSIGAGGNGGWTISPSGPPAATLTYSSGSGTTSLVYTVSRTIFIGETATVSYTQPGNGVEDAAGNDLANITNSSVTNNSEVAVSPNPFLGGAITSGTIK